MMRSGFLTLMTLVCLWPLSVQASPLQEAKLFFSTLGANIKSWIEQVKNPDTDIPPEILASIEQKLPTEGTTPQSDEERFQQAEKATMPSQKALAPPAKDKGAKDEGDASQKNQEGWDDIPSRLNAEAVLIPRQKTIISSARDGRIARIYGDQGDVFRKGDVLIEYHCRDLQSEAEIAAMQKLLLERKNQSTQQLYNLDIISDLDRMASEIESKQAQAKLTAVESRIEDCFIRAEFDGRITNRLANEGEYTRTDRVLMEVASLAPMQASFLLPSKWLRWINISTPLTLKINETDKDYPAFISRIYGEIDPVSQSIQIVADLKPYSDPLLPGMSGQVQLDGRAIRDSGIVGFLEAQKPILAPATPQAALTR
jgi:membrane fusion protein, multidrug efflux system